MELIGGLTFLGNYLNNRDNKKDLDKQNDDLENKSVSSNESGNIYKRDMFTKASKEFNNIAKNRYNKSKNPKKTGVIPKYYNLPKDPKGRKEMNYELFGNNSDSEFSDPNCSDCSSSSMRSASNGSIDMSNMNHFLDRSNKMMDNRKHERKFVKKINDNNNFTRQFDDLTFDNPGNPVSINAIPGQRGGHSAVSRLENERQMALDGGYSNFQDNADMTYGVLDRDSVMNEHMKLKPQFRKSASQHTIKKQAGLNQRKMELFSGLSRDDWNHKQEQEPLFDPVTNIANIYGNPSMTDFYSPRYIPGKEKRNELPFQQIKVGPGLGMGMMANGGGFIKGAGDLYRILPKTVDDLRPKNKPKLSYEGVVVPGQKGTRGPIMGKTENRKPTTFKINNPKDMLKSYGYVQAPKIVGEIDPSRLGRFRGLLRKVHYGPAQHEIGKATPDDMREKHRKTNRQSFKQSGPTNLYLVEGLRGRSAGHDETFIPDLTQRGKDNKRLGGANNQETGKTYAFDIINNVPELNMRNVHAETERAGHMTGNITKPVAIDYTDVRDPTMRDIHNKPDRAGQMTGNIGKPMAFDPNDIPNLTMRAVQNKPDRSGSAVFGGMMKGKTIDYNNVPDPTMRDLHNKPDRTGQGMQPTVQKGYTYDPTDIPDVNMRNIHNKTDRPGKAVQPTAQKGYTYDPTDIPDPTMRDLHNKPDRTGKGMQPTVQKGHTYDPTDIPDVNMRNIHSKTDRQGKAVQPTIQKSYTYDPTDIPDVNMRNIHNKTDRQGKAVQPSIQKSYTYDPTDVPDVNMRNIHSKTDRQGNAIQSSIQKSYTYDPTDVPDVNMRNIHGKTDRQGNAVHPTIQKSYTYDPTDVPNVNMRNIHGKTDRQGNAVQSTMQKGYTYDPTDVPNVNMRNIHSKTDRQGKAIQPIMQKHKTIDYNDVPNVTMRDIHKYKDVGHAKYSVDKPIAVDFSDVPDATMRNIHNYNDVGPMKYHVEQARAIDYTDVPNNTMRDIHKFNDVGPMKYHVEQSRAINYNDVPSPTMRDIHNYDDIGPAKKEIPNSYTINYTDATPATTMREITGETNHIGAPHSHIDEQRSRRDAYNSRVNITREVIAKGRTPNVIKYNKGPTTDLTKYEFKEPIDQFNNSREFAPAPLLQTTDKLPFQMDRNRNESWYENDRFDSYTKENLDNNPYINNQIHKSKIIYS